MFNIRLYCVLLLQGTIRKKKNWCCNDKMPLYPNLRLHPKEFAVHSNCCVRYCASAPHAKESKPIGPISDLLWSVLVSQALRKGQVHWLVATNCLAMRIEEGNCNLITDSWGPSAQLHLKHCEILHSIWCLVCRINLTWFHHISSILQHSSLEPPFHSTMSRLPLPAWPSLRFAKKHTTHGNRYGSWA